MANSRKRTKGKNDKPISFKEAVEATPDIANAYCKGLQALGNYSTKIKLASTHSCEGSVDIDRATKQMYQSGNRWDYCIAYDKEVFFVEIHSSNTSNVGEILKKIIWLENWLNTKAPLINAKKAKGKPAFYWIQTNGFHILPNSPQYRKVIQAGIKPVARLQLG